MFTPNQLDGIDPGYINHRKSLSVFGDILIEEYKRLKHGSDEWLDQWHNNHLFSRIMLQVCKKLQVKTPIEVLFDPSEGEIFCGILSIRSNQSLFNSERVQSQINLPFGFGEKTKGFSGKVLIEIGKEHFISSTLRSHLSGEMGYEKTDVVIIGTVEKKVGAQIVVHPLMIGFPMSLLQKIQQAVDAGFGEMRPDEYEYFPEEIDEFSKCKDVPATPDWEDYMRSTPEEEIKNKFCKLLGDVSRKDWGGEICDHYSGNVHLGGAPISAAFIFKGPAKFKAMTMDMLGKRGDQLYRLAQAPASLLVVQHCHASTEAVIATLKAFATSPVNPRKYCFISGLSTYRILKAYDLL